MLTICYGATGDFSKAAKLCPKVCGHDHKRWENWIFVFAQKQRMEVCTRRNGLSPFASKLTDLYLQAIIPYVPTENPKLGHLVYEMILAYYLANDRQVRTVFQGPKIPEH